MRTLNKNKQKIYYSLYLTSDDVYDEFGNLLPEQKKAYSTPVCTEMNVSASRGTSGTEQFGINENYTKTIVTDDLTCPISEDSILWIESQPDVNGESGVVKHNYAVEKIAKGLYSITYAVKKVEVS